MDSTQAAAEAARRKVKRATGLLRDAQSDLAALAGDLPVLGVTRVHDNQTADSARELIALGVGRHGAVDVIVIPRPTGRTHPPRPRPGEGDSNGTQRSNQAKAQRQGS